MTEDPAMTDDRCSPQRLITLMRAGDLQALDQMSRCYGPRLLQVARRRCRLESDAEDAVQQALLEAGQHLEDYRGEGSPLAWLSTMVSYSCGRMNRGRKNDPALHLVDVPLSCSCDSPEGLAERSELGARLTAALLELSRVDRFALLLASEGWTGPEIAREFGMTPNAVRSRIKRARKQLRGTLADLKRSDLESVRSAEAGAGGITR